METPTQPTPIQQAPVVSQSSWSWGGFILDPVVIIATKNYLFLLVYIVGLFPFIGFLGIIAFKVYMGLQAHNLINSSTTFANPDEARGFTKGIDHAGKIGFFIVIGIIAVLVFALFSLFSVAGFSFFRLLGPHPFYR